MISRNVMMALAVVVGVLAATAAQALAITVNYSFVGSWQPYNVSAPLYDDGVGNGPLAYTAQEAAALLFGGSPGDYVISTAGIDPARINHKAWYDVVGFGATELAGDYFNKYLGLYYGPVVDFDYLGAGDFPSSAASAFVRNNYVLGVNYAFRANAVSAVPVPAAGLLLFTAIGGFAGFGRLQQRRKLQS
jgi:hypothetical protein